MSRSWRAGAILMVAAAALAVTPIDALAQRMGGGARSGSQGGGSHSGFHRGAHNGGPGGRSFAHRRFGGGLIVFAPPFWYGSDLSYDPGPAYAPAPAYGPAVYGPGVYGPGVGGTLALAPSAPSTPSVIEYPTGRWELRGDGITIPYRWVWIPNPPSAPPSSTPPSGEPVTPAPPTSTRPEPPGNTKIYRWTDGQGALHLTDRLDTVPERYRAQARASRPS